MAGCAATRTPSGTQGTAGNRCPLCGAVLPTRDFALPGHRPMVVTMPCACPGAVAEAAAEAAERTRSERARRFAEVWSRSGVPEEFAHVRADFSKADAIDSNRSVYIAGRNGRGKTHRACQYAKGWLVRHVTEEHGVMACRRSLRFVTSQRLASLLKSSWQRWDETEEDVFQRLAGVDLLVLDDLGKGVPSEWFAENLLRLIDERWSAHKPMVITSQYGTSELADRLCKADDNTLGALKSRLRGWCDGEVIEGPDRRIGGGVVE